MSNASEYNGMSVYTDAFELTGSAPNTEICWTRVPKTEPFWTIAVPRQRHSNELTFILCRFVLLKVSLCLCHIPRTTESQWALYDHKDFPHTSRPRQHKFHLSQNSVNPADILCLTWEGSTFTQVEAWLSRYQLILLYHRHAACNFTTGAIKEWKKKPDHFMKLFGTWNLLPGGIRFKFIELFKILVHDEVWVLLLPCTHLFVCVFAQFGDKIIWKLSPSLDEDGQQIAEVIEM